MSGPPAEPVQGQPGVAPAFVPQGYAAPTYTPVRGVPASTWVATLAVAVLVAFVTFGGYLIGEASGASLGIETDVTDRVTVRLPEDWTISEPAEDPVGFLASSAIGFVIIGEVAGRESAQALASAYFNDTLVGQAQQVVAGDVFTHAIPAGEAVSFRYLGTFEGVATPLEGEVFAIQSPSGVAVIIDGWAPEGTYTYVADEILTMAQTIEVTA
jgi:hypothetical protein